MSENKKVIKVNTGNEIIELTIFGENSFNDSIIEKHDAEENGEAQVQIREGCFYEYEVTKGYCLETSEIVSQSKVNRSSGRISPNIYVGTLTIDVLKSETNEKCMEVKLEVQSVKASYRKDYRFMLEEITEKCTDLLLQHSSPVSQIIQPDYFKDPVTAYQRFAFIKSILDTDEFNDSVHKILSSPVTRWKESEIIKDIRSVKRINNASLRQICSAGNRLNLTEDHSLKSTICSVPSKLRVNHKTETVDTPENRFVKHALVSFQSFCSKVKELSKDGIRTNLEATFLEDKLEQILSHSTFKEISAPDTLQLNSPVLQRKEGYREVLRVWLMFDLAAKLIWKGGEDVYSANKRDVAVLYEYWLFFKLLDIVKEVFNIEPKKTDELIKDTKDGLGLQLEQGKYFPIDGIYKNNIRNLRVQFSYNKTFSGNKDYPDGGSWSRSLRPDYTLSIWPAGIEEEVEAERQELIVHIHFDAKYKVETYKDIFGSDEDLTEEKDEQKKGTFKRADLLKMHTYKDAIRRTAGAYVLYPGTEKSEKKGFHEILPGLGAFAVSPSYTNTGTSEVVEFLTKVRDHFINRASQREKMSYSAYETYKDKKPGNVSEKLPESYGKNRNLIPDNTYVLVGYYRNENILKWIEKNRLYNARAGTQKGSLHLSTKKAGAKYLLLHTKNEAKTSRLFKIKENGPRIFSKNDLLKKSYPDPKQEFYLVYEIEKEIEEEFQNLEFDIRKLSEYKTNRSSGIPFSASLTELMNAKTE